MNTNFDHSNVVGFYTPGAINALEFEELKSLYRFAMKSMQAQVEGIEADEKFGYSAPNDAGYAALEYWSDVVDWTSAATDAKKPSLPIGPWIDGPAIRLWLADRTESSPQPTFDTADDCDGGVMVADASTGIILAEQLPMSADAARAMFEAFGARFGNHVADGYPV